jgi:hypothetical protein
MLGGVATSVPWHLELVLLPADGPHGGHGVCLTRVLLHSLLPAKVRGKLRLPPPLSLQMPRGAGTLSQRKLVEVVPSAGDTPGLMEPFQQLEGQEATNYVLSCAAQGPRGTRLKTAALPPCILGPRPIATFRREGLPLRVGTRSWITVGFSSLLQVKPVKSLSRNCCRLTSPPPPPHPSLTSLS